MLNIKVKQADFLKSSGVIMFADIDTKEEANFFCLQTNVCVLFLTLVTQYLKPLLHTQPKPQTLPPPRPRHLKN